jgi:probable phosphoglycerate mutase
MTTTTAELILHFVRHGETTWNAERRFQTPDVPLSARGREQAAEIAAVLQEQTKAQIILASDSARTLETASIINQRLSLPIVEEPGLRERNFGVARGQLYADISQETQARWREPHYRIEEGESWADVYERMGAFLRRLRREPPAREMILVTHGGSMNIAMMCLEGKSIDDFALVPIDNCAVRTVVLTPA